MFSSDPSICSAVSARNVIAFSELLTINLLRNSNPQLGKRFVPVAAKFVSVATLDTSTSLASTSSCTYKYFTFTCRVRLDKPCLCTNAFAALASHRRLILARTPRSFRIAFHVQSICASCSERVEIAFSATLSVRVLQLCIHSNDESIDPREH